MTNRAFTEDFETIVYANSGAVVQGQPVAIGQLIGIAANDYGAGVSGVYYIEGVWEVPATNSLTFTIGRDAKFIAATGKFSNHSASVTTGDLDGGSVAYEAATTPGSGTNYIRVAINVALHTIH